MKTASADAINKTYTGIGDRMSKFLASRGFGQSGTAGKTQLQTELGRAGAIANNEASFSGLQLDQNNSFLSDMLNAAFQKMGSSFTGNSSSSGFGIGGGFGMSGAM